MYTISKEFAFSAAHQLHNVPRGHQCGRLHGHNYTVTIDLHSPELEPCLQWVVDYAELSRIVKPIVDALDHQTLDDATLRHAFFERGASMNPLQMESTAENLARWFHEVVSYALQGKGIAVTSHVSETPKTRATFTLCNRD